MKLLITVDTEEEFDWTQPFSSEHRSVAAIAALPELQAVFDECGVRPTYVIDHPVVATSSSRDVMRSLLVAGNCEIGAHLHPWVNPPHEEEITDRNSYLCNLPLDLQIRKLTVLTEAIEHHLAVRPRTFKAGRYGFDFRLVPALHKVGYLVDTSILAYTDMRDDAGPNFSRFGNEPFLFDAAHAPVDGEGPPILEVPCSVGFTQRPFSIFSLVYRFASLRQLRRFRLRGMMWKSCFLRRVVLSPEGFDVANLKQLLRRLVQERVSAVNVTLHSPSMQPGNTPYTRDAEELKVLVACLREVLSCTLDAGATPMTMSEFARLRTKMA